MSVGIGGYRFLSTRSRYSPEVVEAMLPLIWDLSTVDVHLDRVKCHRHGRRGCRCLDPRTRKATNDRESDRPAMIADLKFGWRKTKMTRAVRRALFLHAIGYSEREIALYEGISKTTAHVRLAVGHMAIADYLNGAVR